MKTAKYFLVIQPEFEELAHNELLETVIDLKLSGLDLGIQNLQVVSGGIEFIGKFPECLYLNHVLKIPSRLLMRLGTFFAKTFPALEAEFRKIPFKSISKITPENFQVAASKSKLNNEKRILECIRRIYPESRNDNKGKHENESKNEDFEIYVRMFDDQCTVSVDTSGEHLHFRGYREKQGAAPLRENFAAGLLQLLLKDYSWKELAKIDLIDPMAGSGTFLFEAALWNRENNFRNYSYQRWLKPEVSSQFNQAIAEIRKLQNEKNKSLLFHKLLGFDNDSQVVKLAKSNIQVLQKFNVSSPELKKIIIDEGDVFSDSNSASNSLSVLDCHSELNTVPNNHSHSDAQPSDYGFNSIVICNPPYGSRIKIRESRDVYFQKLVNSILNKYKPIRFGLIIPAAVRLPKAPQGYKELEHFGFLNNGIRVKFIVYGRC